jgi:ParB family chromosome partitioning protein
LTPTTSGGALTQDAIPATDRRARFVTVAAYEAAGGAVQRDLFAEGDHGVFLLDAALLDRLAMEKLTAEAKALKAEGWQWVEAVRELDYEARGSFRQRHREPLPLPEETQAEQRQLSEEYERLYSTLEEDDEPTCERLDAIEARIAEIEESIGTAYTPEVFAIAGAIVSIGADGEPEVLRGIVRPEDEPEDDDQPATSKPRPEFSAALVTSLTEARSAAISATLANQPHVALAAVVHALACGVFGFHEDESSLQLAVTIPRLREPAKGAECLDSAHEQWAERIPGDPAALWEWCLAQEQRMLLDLLAYCAARSVNAVQAKHDRPDRGRLAHATALAAALNLDMAQWFTPTAANFFCRVGRPTIMAAMSEAKGTPVKRSWAKLTKAALAAQAERELAGSRWLPQPLRA